MLCIEHRQNSQFETFQRNIQSTIKILNKQRTSQLTHFSIFFLLLVILKVVRSLKRRFNSHQVNKSISTYLQNLFINSFHPYSSKNYAFLTKHDNNTTYGIKNHHFMIDLFFFFQFLFLSRDCVFTSFCILHKMKQPDPN